MAKRIAMRALRRGEDQLQIAAEEWANVVATLEDWGWQPVPGERMRMLATDVDVSTELASKLVAAGQRLMDGALASPLSVYPIRAKMDKVYEVTEFCTGGGFRIEEGLTVTRKAKGHAETID